MVGSAMISLGILTQMVLWKHAISGYAFLIYGGAVSWYSRKQELEAEYIAATHAAKEAIWLH